LRGTFIDFPYFPFPVGHDTIPLMTDKKAPKRGNIVSAFLRQSRDEMKQVTWPTRRQTARFTLIVIGITVTAGLYLGTLDYLFTQLMGLII